MPELREGREQFEDGGNARPAEANSEAEDEDDNYDEFGNKIDGQGDGQMDVDDDEVA